MIVFAESNFVLEIVLAQEDSEAAEAILSRAEAGAIELAIPAYALVEPVWEIEHRASQRRIAAVPFGQEVERLRRSRHYAPLIGMLETAPSTLRSIDDIEHDRLQRLSERLLTHTTCLMLDGPVLLRALQIEQESQLTRQDAIVLATILTEAERRPLPEHSMFVTRDRRAFSQFGIVENLRQRNCRVIYTFSDALHVVERFAGQG